MGKKAKLILKGISEESGQPFKREIRTLDEVRESGQYTLVGYNVSEDEGLPPAEYDDCNYCFIEALLSVTRNSSTSGYVQKETIGQTITISNREDGGTNIYNRSWSKGKNDEKWTPWLMMLRGDISVVAPSNDISEKISIVADGLENEVKRAKTAEVILQESIESEAANAMSAHNLIKDDIAEQSNRITQTEINLRKTATVRFDRIKENEATINIGVADTTREVVYYKSGNRFVAADSAGGYWDAWDGMEAYMSGGAVRKDKVYLCGNDLYVWNGSTLEGVQETSQDTVKAVDNTVKSMIKNIDEDGLYICDSDGNVIAMIDSNGNFDATGIGDTIIGKIAEILGTGEIRQNTKDIEDVKAILAQIEENISHIETTEENGFYVCDSNGNVVFTIDDKGNTKFLDSHTEDVELYRQVNMLTDEVAEIKGKADAVDSLIGIKKSGEYYSGSIEIPSVDHDRKNVILRVGLHHGAELGRREKTSIAQSEIYNDVFFGGMCEKNFSDIRFLAGCSILNHRLEHSGNYEVVRDNSYSPGINFAVDYDSGTVYQAGEYTADGGATWQSIPNWSHGDSVFIDSRKILYSIKGSKVFAIKDTSGAYDGANAVEICDVTTTSTGSYASAYPAQGSRTILEDNDGYIYFGTSGPEWNAVIFRSINPDMTPADGKYVKEVYSQEKVHKADGSLDFEVVDQHIHNLYHHKATNTVYAALDNSMRPYGPRVIKTTNNGTDWDEVRIDSKEWTQQRGRDYIPAYIAPDGSFMLGGGEVNILGGQTICKICNTVTDNKIRETSIRSVVNNGTGVRNMTSFGEDFIIAGLNAGTGGNSDIQLLLSEDKGDRWKTIYSENVPPSIISSGAAVRWFSEPFSPNGEEERVLVTGAGAGSSMQFSPLVIYRGGNHYYGEAYVYVGDIPANETKSITVESGYMVQMPNLTREERPRPVYSVSLNEGAGDLVTDNRGNHHKIQGEYEWDSYSTDVRFGNHSPILKDTGGLHGLKLKDGAFIELGKVPGLDFNKGFSVVFWYKWDSDLSLDDNEFMDSFYNRIGAILSSDNYGIGLYRAGYIAGNVSNNARGAGCRVIHRGMYEMVCISVTDDSLPQLIISRNDDYGKQTSAKAPVSWDFSNLSEMTLRIGTPTNAGNVNYPIFIHSVSVYDKVLSMEEVQSLYKGGIRL